jgi:serine/threonine-protein kinase
MATVYLAHDLRHQRKVAVKVLKPELAAVLGAERFVVEIRTTAALQHPHILPLFDSGTADGFLYYVMPFIEGETLRARLDRETQLGVDEAIRIACDVADALDYAHRHGVVHRDVKPENILLHDGRPVVADFGIALAVSAAAGGRMTETGLSLGTPHYMSPEQATADKDITGRSDIYSLASVLYEMLTGNPPHTGASAQQIIMRIIAEPVEVVTKHRRSVPPNVAAALSKALEKLPADRFATARELAQALRNPAFAGDATTGTTGAGSGVRGGRPWLALPFIAASGLAVVALAGWGWTASRASHAPSGSVGPLVHVDLGVPDSVSVLSLGTAASLSLSRDGSTLVFQGQREGEPPALWVRRLGDPEFLRLRGTEQASGPVISADGKEVLFTLVGRLSSIRSVPLQGGTVRTVSDSGGLGATWSESGDILLPRTGSLYVIPADGGPRRLIASPDSSRGLFSLAWPQFLPGDRAVVAAARSADGESWLVVIDMSDGKIRELEIRGTNPQYSLGHLFFATFESEVFAVPFDARTGKVTGPQQLVASGVRVGGGGAAAFAVSRSGTLALLTGSTGLWRRELVAVSRSGVERALAAAPAAYSQPAISPDGRRIAVTIDADTLGVRSAPRFGDVWTIDLATSARARITTDSASGFPVWTADGQRVGYRVRGDSVVYAVPVFGASSPKSLLRGRSAISEIALGRAGGLSAFVPSVVTNGQRRDIWVAPTDAPGEARPFLNAAYDEYAPAISPDGRWIAYVTDRTGRTEVYVRALEGEGAEIPVSVTGGTDPQWSSDGTELFYRAHADATFMVARLVFSPQPDVVRRDSLFSGAYRTGYAVFPGGKELLVVKDPKLEERRRGVVTLMVNWRPGRGGGTSEP